MILNVKNYSETSKRTHMYEFQIFFYSKSGREAIKTGVVLINWKIAKMKTKKCVNEYTK